MSKSQVQPKSIAVCGIDGSGKSTTVASLSAMLVASGQRAAAFRLLSQTASRADILFRHHDKLSTQSFCDAVAVCRRLALESVRGDSANQKFGYWIFDRYVYTDLAYALAHGINVEFIRAVVAETPKPHLTFLIDVPVPLAMKRLGQRGGLWSFQENPTVLEAARAAYLDMASAEKFVVIDGTGRAEQIARATFEMVVAAALTQAD